MEETIAAISTAPGTAGIGIIRMSGKDVFSVLKKIFKPIKEESIEEIKGYTMKYGKIFNPETNEIVDEVLVSILKSQKVILKKICAKLIHMVELLWLEKY